MGCTASKLDHEDTVRRCKDRRRLIKDAVFSRHHLAAAHSDYCRSLRLTGTALSNFAADEPLSVSDSTPSVLLPKPPSVSSFKFTAPPPPIRTRRETAIPASPAPSSIKAPPPPPPLYSPTIASSNLPHILSDSTLKSSAGRRRRSQPKLPHILSDSSPSSTPTTVKSAAKFDYPATYVAHATYPTSPSQASSVWNWENFRPPSPPGSDFFNRRRNEDDNENEDVASYHPKKSYDDHHLEVDESEEEGRETEREEIHCSEWGDHYSTTTSESEDEEIDGDGDGDDERETRSEVRSRSNFGSSAPNDSSNGQRNEYKSVAINKVDEKAQIGRCNGGSGTGTEVSDMTMVVRHRDLKEIVASIKEYFDKAAASGEQVSEMLEIGRAQLDCSLKKTVYHSSGIFSSLSSSWTSKPPLAVKYRLDVGTLDESGGAKSLCSTLERLLAWEKKLYEEVKAREGEKIEHEKKLKTLQSQEYKGEEGIKLDKTRISIKKLQSLIIVTSQAANTTSSAINGLRDSDLVPQLVELCHGLMYMWSSMNQSHEFQNQIVQQVRGLVNLASKGDSTTELHRQATRDLESAVSAWHSSFSRLVKYQKGFISSLHGWFKLTLLPIDSDTSILTKQPSDSFSFIDEWKLALEHLPDTVASENIKSFVHVVHVISTQHSDEMKMKKKTENISKELEKKASSLRNIEKKYYNSYSMVGLGLPDIGQVLDARDPLADKKADLATCQRRLEDEMLKYAKTVEVTRAMTLNNIQTGLPGVFQAMTSFSSLFVEALEKVCTRSYAIK